MDDSNLHSLGYTTKTALIKLRDDIRNVIEEHKKKNPTGYDVLLFPWFQALLEYSCAQK